MTGPQRLELRDALYAAWNEGRREVGALRIELETMQARLNVHEDTLEHVMRCDEDDCTRCAEAL